MDDNENKRIKDYRYYSTQRPVDIGTFPKTPGGPIKIENFDKRVPVEGGAFRAWGVLTYNEPLTDRQMAEYELRSAPDNPHLAYGQYEQQLQLVGRWEEAKRVPDTKRMTWWHPDYGVFIKKDFVTASQITERHDKIVERQKAKPSIGKQLAEGAEQAAKDNAAQLVPHKDRKKTDKEDR